MLHAHFDSGQSSLWSTSPTISETTNAAAVSHRETRDPCGSGAKLVNSRA